MMNPPTGDDVAAASLAVALRSPVNSSTLPAGMVTCVSQGESERKREKKREKERESTRARERARERDCVCFEGVCARACLWTRMHAHTHLQGIVGTHERTHTRMHTRTRREEGRAHAHTHTHTHTHTHANTRVARANAAYLSARAWRWPRGRRAPGRDRTGACARALPASPSSPVPPPACPQGPRHWAGALQAGATGHTSRRCCSRSPTWSPDRPQACRGTSCSRAARQSHPGRGRSCGARPWRGLGHTSRRASSRSPTWNPGRRQACPGTCSRSSAGSNAARVFGAYRHLPDQE